MRSTFDDSDYLSKDLFNGIKRKINELKKNGWRTDKLVACVYDLWMDYMLSDEQEMELYELADPFEEYNDVSKYYENMNYKNPLREVLA